MSGYSGMTIRASCPSRRNAFDKPPTTSARPPTFANGTHSEETRRIFKPSSCSPFVGCGFRSARFRRDTGARALVTGGMRSGSVTGHRRARKHRADLRQEDRRSVPSLRGALRFSSIAAAMKILVTGGAGYIGSICVEELLNAGQEIFVFDDLSEGHRAAIDDRAEFIEG